MADHFFIVGAQRSGTTYLYHLLDQHPAIEMAKPVRPEPKFFLRPDLDRLAREDYLSTYFSEETPVRGEKSTSYIESEYAARALSQWFPVAKIVFLLRNPIDRAISNYKFSCHHNVERLPMHDAFMQEESRRDNYDRTQFSTSPYAYLKRGLYVNYIRQYERYFPRENLLIYLFEELTDNTSALQTLYAALEVDETFIPPDISRVVNASEDDVNVEMDDDLWHYLQDYFADSNRELARYLGRPLEIWDQSHA